MKSWRLPNKEELMTLIGNYSKIGLRAEGYWSSITDADAPSYAWAVLFSSGYVGLSGKYGCKYVRCVRSGQSQRFDNLIVSQEFLNLVDKERWDLVENRFIRLGDCWLDRLTGLEWELEDRGPMEWEV